MACEMLFAEVEVDLEERGQQSQKNFKLHGEIAAKRLFYNERETHQIETLTSLLGVGLNKCNGLMNQVVTFLYRRVGNEKATVLFSAFCTKIPHFK